MIAGLRREEREVEELVEKLLSLRVVDMRY
jgi:hypothetical protein